ncbi:MFS transporter [Oceanobacillus rekensis]|uniref:MFS transporter n=1 Tax=Oceanobacillus rekensis TaxID=937927 RepID=UPI000B44BDF9|nr:MFS transporter [Oceanobacillus rekensis]
MSTTSIGKEQQYNTAKLWQIGFFALNNMATNLYMFMLTFVSYYAAGIAGLTVAIVSIVLTAMRVFDGITDPIVGFIIDKTESKFGKFRPLMILGNVILATSIILMYSITHTLPLSFQLIFFILTYALYVIGYTFQTAVTKAAQTVITNSPKQRPLFSIFDGIYTTVIFTLGQVYVASYLIGKYGDFNMGLFTELNTFAIILSAICTILAVIGIAGKDKKEFYGLADSTVNTRFRDYWPILKGNKPLKLLITAVTADKLAFSLLRQSVVMVMIFGILIGDYALSGTVSMITVVPILLITFIAVAIARKRGMRSSFIKSTWISFLSLVGLVGLFLVIGDPTSLSGNIGIGIVLFIILYTLAMGFGAIPSTLVNPMIADISDYETYKSGRYVPGMLGTLFSFIDKLVTSLAPAIVGLGVALIGFTAEFPTVNDPLTTPLFTMTLLLGFGLPALLLIVSLVSMKFYSLDDKRMEEIQEELAKMKAAGKVKETKGDSEVDAV